MARLCAAQEVVGARARFPKPLEVYELLASFGSNILVTEGDEWKRQRKIAAPAFSEVRFLACALASGVHVLSSSRAGIEKQQAGVGRDAAHPRGPLPERVGGQGRRRD